jgi:(R)-2-hydroxyacyl-CoA dehydratese activating ATPase
MNVGIDFGSRNVKIAILNKELSLIESKIYDSIYFYSSFLKDKNNFLNYLDINKLGLSLQSKIVTTGYGKHNLKIEGVKVVSEQKAHVHGALKQTGLKNFLLLDIGGQDTKIIKVQNCKIFDVYMNDKCGASSGRYLENMATVLKMKIEELSDYFLNPTIFNSTCAVFGESEVIGKIFQGYPISEIAAGVNYSVFAKVSNVISGMLEKEPIVFVGGVANNKAIYHYLLETFQVEIIIPKHNLINGAIGASMLADT